jgi:hypothetical protein
MLYILLLPLRLPGAGGQRCLGGIRITVLFQFKVFIGAFGEFDVSDFPKAVYLYGSAALVHKVEHSCPKF